MYVCICHAVTDGQIREMLERGCETVRAIQRASCAGKSCGACLHQIKEMTDAYWHERDELDDCDEPAAPLTEIG